jgi:cytoskeletal protein RodZ
MYTAYPDRKEGCRLKELQDWEEYESAEPRDDQEDLMPGGGKNSLTAFYIVVAVFVLAMILMVIFMGVDKSEDKTEPESSTEVSAKTESTPEQTPPSSSQQDSSQEDQ